MIVVFSPFSFPVNVFADDEVGSDDDDETRIGAAAIWLATIDLRPDAARRSKKST